MDKFIECFRKTINIYDPQANSSMTRNNTSIKVLADWSRKACDKLEQLHAELEEWRNNEGSVCPEDVGFVEFIRVLQTENEELRTELSEWQCGIMGDKEIMKRIEQLQAELQTKNTALEKIASGYFSGHDRACLRNVAEQARKEKGE